MPLLVRVGRLNIAAMAVVVTLFHARQRRADWLHMIPAINTVLVVGAELDAAAQSRRAQCPRHLPSPAR